MLHDLNCFIDSYSVGKDSANRAKYQKNRDYFSIFEMQPIFERRSKIVKMTIQSKNSSINLDFSQIMRKFAPENNSLIIVKVGRDS